MKNMSLSIVRDALNTKGIKNHTDENVLYVTVKSGSFEISESDKGLTVKMDKKTVDVLKSTKSVAKWIGSLVIGKEFRKKPYIKRTEEALKVKATVREKLAPEDFDELDKVAKKLEIDVKPYIGLQAGLRKMNTINRIAGKICLLVTKGKLTEDEVFSKLVTC